MPYLTAKTPAELKHILDELIQKVLPIFEGKLQRVILFGSYARGDYNEESDIDVMFLIDDKAKTMQSKYRKPVQRVISAINWDYDVLLCSVLQNEQDFYAVVEDIPFYHNVEQESLNSSAIDLANQQTSTAVNRAYYCIFHSMRAILAMDGFDSKKHSGVIAYFRKEYIKTKIFDKTYSAMIESAFTMRNNSDYVDFYETTLDDAREQVENARLFLRAVEAYLQDIWDTPKNT